MKSRCYPHRGHGRDLGGFTVVNTERRDIPAENDVRFLSNLSNHKCNYCAP